MVEVKSATEVSRTTSTTSPCRPGSCAAPACPSSASRWPASTATSSTAATATITACSARPTSPRRSTSSSPRCPAGSPAAGRPSPANGPSRAPGAAAPSPSPARSSTFCSAGLPEYPVSLLPHGREVVAAAAGRRLRRSAPGARALDAFSDAAPARLAGHAHRAARLRPAGRRSPGGAAVPALLPRLRDDPVAVPVWAGTRPWEQLPFQWSCHVERAPGEIEHREFIDTSGDAPMRSCADTLIAALGDEGPVFVYSGFEKGVLAGLAARFPSLERRSPRSGAASSTCCPSPAPPGTTPP